MAAGVVSRSFSFEAGTLVRGQVKRELASAAWQLGLDIDFQEEKGFLESMYRATVIGAEPVVENYMRIAKKWFRDTT